MSDALDTDTQRDLTAEAHRIGVVDLQVLVLLTDLHRVLLVEYGRPLHSHRSRWAVPNLSVLPGELICDTLDRLCCRHLRIDPITCPPASSAPSPSTNSAPSSTSSPSASAACHT
ncbi:hypothetical protein ACWEQ8_28355 [Streptomyces noursei]